MPVEKLAVLVDAIDGLDEVVLLLGHGGEPAMDATVQERLDLRLLLLEEPGRGEAGIEDEGLLVQRPRTRFHLRRQLQNGHDIPSSLGRHGTPEVCAPATMLLGRSRGNTRMELGFELMGAGPWHSLHASMPAVVGRVPTRVLDRGSGVHCRQCRHRAPEEENR